jgi:hypothetical protein
MSLNRSSLEDFIEKTLEKAKKEKKNALEPKLQANFENVTNQDTQRERWKKNEAQDWRSDTFIGKVRAKVWTLYSVFLDTVLMGGQVPFTLKPSPYGDLEEDPGVEDRMEIMRDRIKEQLRDRHADRGYMKAWLSMGYYGEAWKEYDVDTVTRRVFKPVSYAGGSFSQFAEASQYADYQLEEIEEPVPGWGYVSIWDMFWDLEEWDPQDMAYVFRRIMSSSYDLRTLEGEGYDPEAIEEVIEELKGEKGSVDEADQTPGRRALAEKANNISRYRFHMRAPKELVDDYEKKRETSSFEVEEDGNDVFIMGEIAEGRLIRFIKGPKWKPFLRCPLEIDLDGYTGRGVPDNMDDVQRFLNGALRAFEDNKKLTANVMMAVKRRYFKKPGELDSVFPGKQFDVNDEVDDVRKAIMPIVFPDVGETLISAITLAEKWCDDVSLIPTFMQGFTLPKHKADTAYELSQLQQNAGKYIGQAIRNNDEFFIEPEITVLYEYNMMDPDFQGKGNWKVHAGGFNSFQSRVLKVEEMKGLLALVLSNETLVKEAKLRPHLEVIYKSLDEDPDDFLKSEEEKVQEQEQEQALIEAERQKEAEEFERKVQLEIEKERVKGQSRLEEERVESEGDIEEATHESMLRREEAEEEMERQVVLKELYGDSRGTAKENRGGIA